MKTAILLMLAVVPAICFAQLKDTTAQKEEPFVPVQLYFVMLTSGTNRTQDSITAIKIQEAHIANIVRLSKEGKMIVAGPFMDDTKWRGIFIMKCTSEQECEALLKTDPAIAAGRLNYEIHPWMTGRNCLFQ